MRSLRGEDFIPLPVAGEAGTLTLAEDLDAAARGAADLPAPVEGALVRVGIAAETLQEKIALRERAGSAADPRARAADRVLDDAWGAFQCWLLGWTRLPDRAHPRVSEARALYQTLFPRGLQFLTLDFKGEWGESHERLRHLEGPAGSLVTDLGGSAFLAVLTRAQRAYGEALLITRAGDDAEEPDAQVLRALAEAHMAMRDYVAQVAAALKRSDPASVALAERLLAPIASRTAGAVPGADASSGAAAWGAVDDAATMAGPSEPT